MRLPPLKTTSTLLPRIASLGILLFLMWNLPAWGQVWQRIPLPSQVDYLTSMQCAGGYIYGAMHDSAGNDIGLYRTQLASPGQWEFLGLAGRGIVWDGIIAPDANGDNLLVGVQGTPRIMYSSDAGQNWVGRDVGISEDIITLGWNGAYPGRVYATALSNTQQTERIYYSTDFGVTWIRWTHCTGCSSVGFLYLAVPQNGDNFARSEYYSGYFEAFPFATINGGTEWHITDSQGLSGVPSDIALSSVDPQHEFFVALTGTRSAIGKWNDSGFQSWLGPSPFYDYTGLEGIECPLWDAGTLYAAGVVPDAQFHPGMLEVAKSSDFGTNWTSVGGGLPSSLGKSPTQNWDKYHFLVIQNRRILLYATWGAGLWMLNLENPSSTGSTDSVRLLLSYPQPNPSAGRVTFTLSGSPIAHVSVLDVNGRVLRLLDNSGSRSSSRIAWDGRTATGVEVPSGTYWIRAEVGSNQMTRRILVVR